MLNKEHLLNVKQHILEEPRRLKMSSIAEKTDDGDTISDSFCYPNNKHLSPPCGTVGCIAGWSGILRGLSVHEVDLDQEQEFLGLNTDDLFFPDQWDIDLHQRYARSTSVRVRANLVGEAIDRVIKNDGHFDYELIEEVQQ